MPIEIGGVRGMTRNVGAGNVVFGSPRSFAVGSAISFTISTPSETESPVRFECSGIVTADRQSASGGFETAATIDSIRILPLDG